MKNILRKLHIGGNNEGEADAGLIIEGRSFQDGSAGSHSGGARESSSVGSLTALSSSGSPTSQSTSPAAPESNNNKPSGLTTFLNAVKDSVGRVNSNEKLSNPISKTFGQLRNRLDSGHNGGESDSSTAPGRRTSTPQGSFKRGAPSPPGSFKRGSLLSNENQKSIQSNDELNVQRAMALSISGNFEPSTAEQVKYKADIEEAKRISLGVSPASGISVSDTTSYRYWASNTVEYNEVVPDGFYDLFGLSSDSSLSEWMPLLSDLQKMPISETSKIEVVLVDRRLDPDLVRLETQAAELAAKSDIEDVGSLRIDLSQKIALIVADHMGGPVGSETDMLSRWQKASWNQKSTIENIVLSLGSLNVGLTRHRALLFKVLADHVGVPCQLVKGRHYPGVEKEGAVNIIKVDENRDFIIDLMGAPGALIPSDNTVSNSPEVVPDDVSVADASPKSMKTEHSFVSSTQSSPSGSARSIRSETGDNKETKGTTIQKGNSEQIVTNMTLDGRHHSEPVELQELDVKNAFPSAPTRLSHLRSPSWTEGIGLPGGRQVKVVAKDVSQLVLDAAKENSQLAQKLHDAAKENPRLAQKLHDVLLESGVIADMSPTQLYVQVAEDKKLEDDKIHAQDTKANFPSHPLRKKVSAGSGRPPSGSGKITQQWTGEVVKPREALPRLNSVEGLGDRRPLAIPPVDLLPLPEALPLALPMGENVEVPVQSSLTAALPASISVSISLPGGVTVAVPEPVLVPIPLALPAVAAPVVNVENRRSPSQQGFIGHVPVAAAAAAAATAAVVASSMVAAAAAAAKSEGGGDAKLEVPIAAAATATAAVVAATSAVAGRTVESSESSPVNSGRQTSSGREARTSEEIEKDGTHYGESRSDEKRSEAGGSTPQNSHRAVSTSGDGLDGEVSVEEERNSEDMSRSIQKRYDAVLADVAEWEIPWEDIVIGDRIGLGSYGEVYRGDWHGSDVAVKKFLDQDLSGYALEEFRSEVRIMRRLRHPNVVLFMGAVTRAPHLSIVTEFLPRGSLYRLIHRPNNQLDDRRRLRMALDVAKGMNYLHSGNPVIVHRDLKSPNLLVDKNWVVKVCDFGLSRMKHNTFLSSKSTAGTPEWMAPEMLRNEPSDEKCDIYSFGIILWELATLQQPWGGMNPMQVVGAVGFQNRRLEIPPEMDPGLAKIIRECWHDNPSKRPSFAQLMVALRPLQRPLSAAPPAETSKQAQTSQGSTIQLIKTSADT